MIKRYMVWDMDGTLIDSMDMWNNLTDEYLESQGIAASEYVDLGERLETLSLSEGAVLLAERFPHLGQPSEIAGQINDLLAHHYREHLPLKPGVEEALNILSVQKVHMCVASATPQSLIQSCLARLGVLHYFDFILSCESLNTSKREPRIYWEAAHRWEVNPGEVAVCEDAYHALETAQAAGFYTVAVFDKASSHQWQACVNLADECITDMRSAFAMT
ncbi:HAD family hydrolase [Alloscardovia omnicolens]|uniref:HAD family hydrolase n=1 Tax=Alloscardovia omnicolens TaxID=419015 RepID=UPI003A74D259